MSTETELLRFGIGNLRLRERRAPGMYEYIDELYTPSRVQAMILQSYLRFCQQIIDVRTRIEIPRTSNILTHVCALKILVYESLMQEAQDPSANSGCRNIGD